MSFDEITEPLDRRLADGLTRLAAVARQLDWQSAEAAGLSPTQADILRFVASRPAGARLTAAAAHAGVRKATASDAVTALERAGVAVTPGVDFGANAEGYLRFSYANSLEKIAAAMDRLGDYLRARGLPRS